MGFYDPETFYDFRMETRGEERRKAPPMTLFPIFIAREAAFLSWENKCDGIFFWRLVPRHAPPTDAKLSAIIGFFSFEMLFFETLNRPIDLLLALV